MSGLTLTDRGERESCLGTVRQLKIFAPDYRALNWRDVWERFAQEYPGRWAVQVFPPAERLIDGKAVYHLWLLNEEPWGLDIK